MSESDPKRWFFICDNCALADPRLMERGPPRQRAAGPCDLCHEAGPARCDATIASAIWHQT